MNRAARRRRERPHDHRFTPGPSTQNPDGSVNEGEYDRLCCDICEVNILEVPEGEHGVMNFIPGYSPGLVWMGEPEDNPLND